VKVDQPEKLTLTTLPPEIFNLICEKLSLRTLLKLSAVNRELYYNRLNEEYFVQRIQKKRAVRNIVYDISSGQCEMCGQEENEEDQEGNEEQQEETVDEEETQNTSGADEQSNIEEKLISKKAGLNVKDHPIADILLCELCIETKEYRMINDFDARKKFPLRNEDWEELPYVHPERYSRYQRRRPRAYWEAEVRAFSQNYYLATFGMTLEEYQLQQEAEELERKNVTLPARRLQRGIQAVELNGGMTEAVDYFNDQFKMGRIDPHGHGYQFLTLMETMLTAPECPSHATIQHLMLYWSDLKALWGLLEKYQQYLTMSIEKAKDLIAEKSGDVCPLQRTDGSYTNWTLYYNFIVRCGIGRRMLHMQ